MYYVRGGSQIDLTSISYFRLLQYDDNSEKIETQSEEVPVHVRDVFKSGDSDKVDGDSSDNAKTQSMINKRMEVDSSNLLLKPSKNEGSRQNKGCRCWWRVCVRTVGVGEDAVLF